LQRRGEQKRGGEASTFKTNLLQGIATARLEPLPPQRGGLSQSAKEKKSKGACPMAKKKSMKARRSKRRGKSGAESLNQRILFRCAREQQNNKKTTRENISQAIPSRGGIAPRKRDRKKKSDRRTVLARRGVQLSPLNWRWGKGCRAKGKEPSEKIFLVSVLGGGKGANQTIMSPRWKVLAKGKKAKKRVLGETNRVIPKEN